MGIAELWTPADVRRLLDEHGLAPRKSAGQNFVTDPNTVRMIVREARLQAGDVVVEIGPGLGSLTLALADAASHVHAIEIDAGFAALLGDEVFAGRDDVTVHHADAMTVDLDALPGDGPLRVVANLPYNVATPLVVHALSHDRVADLYVMVQREVGERWCASVGDPLYAGISVKLQVIAEASLDARISRQVFHPVPNVDSVMVRITRRTDGLRDDGYARVAAVVDTAFQQRRKTVRKTLRQIVDVAQLDAAFVDAGIDPGARPEQLEPQAFVALAAALGGALDAPASRGR